MKLVTRILTSVLFCSFVGLALLSPATAWDQQIGIKIKMAKEIFKAGEPVDGSVVITGDMSVTFPGRFKVELFKGDQLIRQSYTNAPVFFGDTDYKFKNFGLDGINNSDEDIGSWKILITWEGNPASSAQADFEIVDGK